MSARPIQLDNSMTVRSGVTPSLFCPPMVESTRLLPSPARWNAVWNWLESSITHAFDNGCFGYGCISSRFRGYPLGAGYTRFCPKNFSPRAVLNQPAERPSLLALTGGYSDGLVVAKRNGRMPTPVAARPCVIYPGLVNRTREQHSFKRDFSRCCQPSR